MCFFFNDTATTEIYTLSLHDALPIYLSGGLSPVASLSLDAGSYVFVASLRLIATSGTESNAACLIKPVDRKSTRLNSSHANISYAVFCLKKKNQCRRQQTI